MAKVEAGNLCILNQESSSQVKPMFLQKHRRSEGQCLTVINVFLPGKKNPRNPFLKSIYFHRSLKDVDVAPFVFPVVALTKNHKRRKTSNYVYMIQIMLLLAPDAHLMGIDMLGFASDIIGETKFGTEKCYKLTGKS